LKKPCEGRKRRRALTWSRSQFDIEGEDVTERDTGVDKATVTSGDAELSVVKSTAALMTGPRAFMGDSSLFWQALYPRARVRFKSETLSQQVSLSLTVGLT